VTFNDTFVVPRSNGVHFDSVVTHMEAQILLSAMLLGLDHNDDAARDFWKRPWKGEGSTDLFRFFHGVWFAVGEDAGLTLTVAVAPRCASG